MAARVFSAVRVVEGHIRSVSAVSVRRTLPISLSALSLSRDLPATLIACFAIQAVVSIRSVDGLIKFSF